jgi:hypothetical protein
MLAEHRGLRLLMEETRRVVLGDASDAHAPASLRDHLGRLAAALQVHNDGEETALRELVRGADAWGAVRVELMDESHVGEHEDLERALLAADAEPDRARTRDGVLGLLGRIEAHMAREEEVLLGEDVLRDDDVVIEYFGG